MNDHLDLHWLNPIIMICYIIDKKNEMLNSREIQEIVHISRISIFSKKINPIQFKKLELNLSIF